jgi:hypothetical protein
MRSVATFLIMERLKYPYYMDSKSKKRVAPLNEEERDPFEEQAIR